MASPADPGRDGSEIKPLDRTVYSLIWIESTGGGRRTLATDNVYTLGRAAIYGQDVVEGIAMELDGKVAVITGGGSGIGRATAIALAQQGAQIVVAGRRIEPLHEMVHVVRSTGRSALAVQTDLSDETAADALIGRVISDFGQLDVAVNAAGAIGVGPLIETSETLFDDVMSANVKTTWLAMKYQIPAMAQTGGAIVNVSSGAGLGGTRHGSVYSAAKHAVIGLTKSAALEAAEYHIRVNAVCPGPTSTEQFDRFVEVVMPGQSPAEAAKLLGAQIPLGRMAEPVDIAAAIVWLAGPASGFMTGAAVPVDGGSSAG